MSTTFIIHLPDQLTASGINILATRLSNRGDNACVI
jgi:hypothetical protein